MRVAVIGSRNICDVALEKYLPQNISELVSGGARGIDTLAREYAYRNGLKITEFLPNYKLYGKAAPIKRNDSIIDYADMVVALWDGTSRGTKYVIENCRKKGKPINVYIL